MNEQLAAGPIRTLLLKLAIPSITAQIVTLLYTLVDRIYIGRIPDGAAAMAAIGICLPIVSAISALANLFGKGGAPLAAIAMGRQDPDEAEHILGNSVLGLMVCSLTFSLVVLNSINPLLHLLGAGSESFAYGKQYLSIYAGGMIFACFCVGLNPFINTQGFTTFGLMTNLLGAGLNILLDPILIFGLNMGIAGAAWATLLSQAASAL